MKTMTKTSSAAPAARVFACLAAGLIAFALAAALPATAWARDHVNVDASCSLTLTGAPTDVSGGASFTLYKVADVLPVGVEYALTEKFAAYEGSVKLEDNTQDEWRGAAQALAGYVARDGIAGDLSVTTNASGNATLSGLPTGLYLVVGAPCSGSGFSYTFSPFMVQLPALDESNGTDTWVYDATANLKYGVDEEVVTEITAVKVWSDGESSARPASVDVQLLRDGKVFATETLNADNNWRVAWKGLDPDASWQVVEASVPEGYTVTVNREDGVYTITNTIVPGTPDKPTTPGDDKLPQTGMLWWPVPVLAVVGLALVVAGLYRRGSSRRGR